MPSMHWFRFTLGQGMAATAFFAVLIATALSERWFVPPPGMLSSFADPKFWLSSLVRFAGVGVCLYNLRVSWWIWPVLAGYIGPWFVSLATGLIYARWLVLSSPGDLGISRVSWAVNLILSLVFVWGLAGLFRDLRRRLPSVEEVPD